MKTSYAWLGYIRWDVGDEPEEYKKCQKLGHKLRIIKENDKGTNHSYWCDICGITWSVDSSD